MYPPNYLKSIVPIFVLFLFTACKNDASRHYAQFQAPVAKKEIKTFTEFGQDRLDEYFWLNNANDTSVLAILRAENEYSAKCLAHTEGVQKKMYDEMVARVEQKAASVPVKKNGFWYYTRYETGKEYPLICRKKGTWNAAEEVLFDVPTMAKGHAIFRLFEFEVSRNDDFVAYLVDTSGDRRNTLFIKNIKSGQILKEQTTNVANGGLVWTNEDKNLLYLTNDATVRANKVLVHAIGTDASKDKTLYTENDVTFSLSMELSESKKYVFITSGSTTTSEVRYLKADKMADLRAKIVQPRTRDLLYAVNHFDTDEFYIYNNYKGAKNFKLSTTPLSKTDTSAWKDLILHSDSSLLTRYFVLKNHVIVQDKVKGLNRIRVFDRQANYQHEVDFSEESYVANMSLGDEDDFLADSIRYNYQSLTTPSSTFSYNLKTKTKGILKADIVANYQVSRYETKRIWASGRDGTQIPVSIVYDKKKFLKNGTNPLLLYAYGSYGANSEPYFNQQIISLLDRGFVFAIAHIRGGQELGRTWYEDGKLLNKKNTFNDFVDCAAFLAREKYSSNDKMFANGVSAGGMLMGAVINQHPGMFRGVLAEVPWMDVITDMFNDQLPLTTLEYDEWGDPRKKEFYDYMLSWSPYDNVKKANYPAIFTTGGLHDTQVPYFSPAKWVQRVREKNTGQNPVYFKCNMEAGHGGQSGRFDRFKLTALKYAFMLDCLNQNE